MSMHPKPLYRLLLGLFRSVDDLYEFLSNYDYSRADDLVNSLPATSVPKTTYVLKVVEQAQAHGLDDQQFFEALADRFPSQVDRIEAARRNYLGNADTAVELPENAQPAITSLSREPPAKLADQQEKVTGDRPTFLDIAYLAMGYERSKSVAKLRMRFAGRWYCGTAFLVRSDTLLTAYHNLWMADARADEVQVIFDYERAINKPESEGSIHLADLRSFLGEEKLDWAMLRLAEPQPGRPLATLSERDVRKEDRVAIIQHPNGMPKQVALHHNLVTYADERIIQYLTDTEPGSSGSPVFDTDWNVVAVHHLGGNLAVPGARHTVYCNQGVAVKQIRSGLSDKGGRPSLRSKAIFGIVRS